jgi:MraZ protein
MVNPVGFIGAASVSVDAKGRTNLPRELRKQLPLEAQGVIIVTLFAERTLALRPLQEWNRYVVEELEPLARKDKTGAQFVMRITSMAKMSELDAQNRIALSPELMKYAGLEREVTFAGDGARIRLWNPARFERIIAVTDEDADGFEKCFYQG